MSGYHCKICEAVCRLLRRDLVIALELVLPHDLSSGSWFSTRRYSDPSYVQLHRSLTGCTDTWKGSQKIARHHQQQHLNLVLE